MTAWVAVGLVAALWLAAWTPLRPVAFISMLVAPDLVIACVSVVIALAAACRLRKTERRRGVASLALAWLLVGGLFAGRVLAQGIGSSALPEPGEASLTVVSWNAQGIPPDQIAERVSKVVAERGVDVIVLPETGDAIANQVFDEFERLGWDSAGFTEEATAVIMRSDLAALGDYRVLPGHPAWAGIAVAPRTPSGTTPIILAPHIQQPSPGNLVVRAEHLAWAEGVCQESDFVFAVGDFNTTLNHLDGARLGRCSDVAAASGAGASATWPTWLPAWLGISIDRAIVGEAFDPHEASFEALRDVPTAGVEGWGSGSGADHWPILVTLPQR